MCTNWHAKRDIKEGYRIACEARHWGGVPWLHAKRDTREGYHGDTQKYFRETYLFPTATLLGYLLAIIKGAHFIMPQLVKGQKGIEEDIRIWKDLSAQIKLLYKNSSRIIQ